MALAFTVSFVQKPLRPANTASQEYMTRHFRFQHPTVLANDRESGRTLQFDVLMLDDKKVYPFLDALCLKSHKDDQF